MPDILVPDDEESHEAVSGKGGGALSRIKDVLGIIQSGLTIIAIGAAGIWFYLQATTEPKANIKHEVTHRRLSPDYVWLRAEINVTNIGKRPLVLPSGVFRLQQVLPLTEKGAQKLENQELVDPERGIVLWPQFAGASYEKELNLTIFPGETDTLDCEFVIPASAETVKIYTFFPVEKNAKEGWKGASIYDVKKEGK